MISYTLAKQIADKKLVALERECGQKLVLIESRTMETEKLWLFFYTNAPYSETQKFTEAIAGNPPIAIEKSNGRTHSTGAARAIEYYIERIENSI